jgi:hypothetical protein
MNNLEKEIINNLRNSPQPLDNDQLLRMSKITKHSRRINATILSLEEKEILFLISAKREITRFSNKYGLNGVHPYG